MRWHLLLRSDLGTGLWLQPVMQVAPVLCRDVKQSQGRVTIFRPDHFVQRGDDLAASRQFKTGGEVESRRQQLRPLQDDARKRKVEQQSSPETAQVDHDGLTVQRRAAQTTLSSRRIGTAWRR